MIPRGVPVRSSATHHPRLPPVYYHMVQCLDCNFNHFCGQNFQLLPWSFVNFIICCYNLHSISHFPKAVFSIRIISLPRGYRAEFRMVARLRKVLHWMATALPSVTFPSVSCSWRTSDFHTTFSIYLLGVLSEFPTQDRIAVLSVKVLLAGNCRNPLRREDSDACPTSAVFRLPAVTLAVLCVHRSRPIRH
jgi:hypothetical protein